MHIDAALARIDEDDSRFQSVIGNMWVLVDSNVSWSQDCRMGRGAFSVRFLVMFDNVDFNRQLIKHNFNITLFVKELIFTNINFRKRCYVGQAHIARIAKELPASVAFRARMPFGNAAQEGIVGDSHFSEWIGFADKSTGG